MFRSGEKITREQNVFGDLQLALDLLSVLGSKDNGKDVTMVMGVLLRLTRRMRCLTARILMGRSQEGGCKIVLMRNQQVGGECQSGQPIKKLSDMVLTLYQNPLSVLS